MVPGELIVELCLTFMNNVLISFCKLGKGIVSVNTGALEEVCNRFNTAAMESGDVN